MTKTISQLRPGDVVLSMPYAGAEKLPIVVERVAHARASGYRIVCGTDAAGCSVQVPVGHCSNRVEVQS